MLKSNDMKKIVEIRFAVLALLLCVSALPAFAQTKASLTVTVTDAETNEPVSYALAQLPETGLQLVTDYAGTFQVKDVTPKTYKAIVSFIGYETLETFIELKPGHNEITLQLKPANFRIDEVVVTAESSKAGAATSSMISRTAMDHIQSTSLSDVMRLLPGATMPSVNELTLRTASTMTIRGGQSLGTAIIMDGSPLSNNANMQNMTSAIGAAMPSGISLATPTSGIDLRQISTDNIESVEVIRGIASVEYGDITSGAVLVNSKAGRSPLSVKFSMNPNLYQISANHGITLGAGAASKAGAVNYSADYTFSQYEPTEGYSNYHRVNGSVGYTNSLGRWYTNSSLSFGYYRDRSRPNPDDDNDFKDATQREYRLRFNTKGTISFNEGWFKNIKYSGAFSMTDKHSEYEDMAGNAEWTFSTSRRDGEILSSLPGREVYLDDGTLLVDGKSVERGWQVPNTYMYAYDIYGREFNTYLQAVMNFSGTIGRTTHLIKVGGDFKSDGNTGRGKVFDPECPPYRNLSYDYATQRERAYDDIPFMNTLGLFAEENFNLRFAGRNLNIVAGVRYDRVFGFDDVVAPRINASLEIIPDRLFIRGGYGVMAKTPTLALLYPQEAYFDLLNFNNSLESAAADAQKFQITTTRVFSTVNERLEMAKATKYEVGVDFRFGKVSGSLTAFKDYSHDGYSIGRTEDSYHQADLTRYKAASYAEDGTTLPALSVESTGSVLLSHTMPTNNLAYETGGLEMTVDFGRIDAIRTRFILDGAWTRHESWSKGYDFAQGSGATPEDHVGIYLPGNRSYSDIISTNLQAVHNIPSIGFVISATANVIWRENDWNLYRNDEFPVKYISAADGKIYDTYTDADGVSHNLSEWSRLFPAIKEGTESIEALPAEFRQFYNIYNNLDVRRNIRDSFKSPLLCINVNVTKEIRDFMRISFYANNLFRSTPLWESTKYPGSFTRRNSSTFFFGLSLTAIIK